MKESISIPVSEVKEVFELLEEINQLFHQPLNHKDLEAVEMFAKSNYPAIKKLYYETVWNWLPKDEQEYYDKR